MLAGKLFVAVAAGDVEEVEKLVSQGADLMSLRNEHESCLNMAIIRRDLPMAKTLVRLGMNPNDLALGFPPLHQAVIMDKTSDLPIVKFLLDAGADPNGRNESIVQPLNYAVMVSNTLAVEELVRRGAIVDTRKGKTRWVWAIDERAGHNLEGKPRELVVTMIALGAAVPDDFDQEMMPTEDEVAEVRWRVYFRQSLVEKLGELL